MNQEAKKRCEARKSRIDRMTPDMRALVHEFGLTVVDAFISCGVTKPRQIRHLVATVRSGSFEIGNREGSPALIPLDRYRLFAVG